MLKILDRYIISKYIKTVFFVILLVTVIFSVIDYTEKNDDFIKNEVPLKNIIGDYYLSFIPYLANLLSPILVFVATIFVTARLSAHTEIVAILSSGVSFLRFMRSYLIGAIFLAIILFVTQAWILPNANKAKNDFELKYLVSSKSKAQFEEFREQHNYFILGDNSYAYFYTFNPKTGLGTNFTLEHVDERGLTSKLWSTRVSFIDSLKKWRFGPYYTRTYDVSGKPEINYYDKTIDTTLNLSSSDFLAKYKRMETLTLPELDQVIQDIRLRKIEKVEPYLVEKYHRYAYPFALIILTMMGVIVSARKSRGGVGGQIAIGLALAFVFVAVVYLFRIMADGGSIDPLLSAWLPIGAFTLVTLVLYRTVPK